MITVDGNEAAARTAYALNEICAIYPITPSSPMGESADAWAAVRQPNLWGAVPHVIEMQSEGGAAGAVHGALQAGALTTTFTSSQGLLLMIPNMYKIAGELTSTVFHVAARSVATHALSIFGDHSDVMAVRATGWALLAAGSVQEVHDFACIAQMATLACRVPFVHFFDGFRTSHEMMRIAALEPEELRKLIDDDLVSAHRARALSPDRPVLRGSAQNPDVFFQAREACNPFYAACPRAVQTAMDRFELVTGRAYRLFNYTGAPDAERVVVMMGSGAEAAHECVEYLSERGERVGLVRVRLFRPFDVEAFVHALPGTVRAIAVLDRTKEPGAAGEPLYQDVVTALHEAEFRHRSRFLHRPAVVGGRYGLSSKELTPAMVKAVLDELQRKPPRNHFTVGIRDDVTLTSLDWDATFSSESPEVFRALFYGLGSDGTVGANKNSIKIIGEHTDLEAQGYFVYDSKKAGSVTVSHLRFGKQRIRSSYLIDQAHFIGCHHPGFLDKQDLLGHALPRGVFLLNSPVAPDRVWDSLPRQAQEHLIRKRLRFFVIDAFSVANQTGMGGRINTIMQTCFFAISGVLPREEALAHIKKSIEETYGKKGPAIVQMNCQAVDQTLAALHEVEVPEHITTTRAIPLPVSPRAPEFVRQVTSLMIAGRGDELPVSALPPDGTFPVGTARWEKRNIAAEIPIWEAELCIQCGKCAIVCPHAAIRSKAFPRAALAGAPAGFKASEVRGKDFEELGDDMMYSIQVAPEDCTGCGICVEICPAKSKQEAKVRAINMRPHDEHVEREALWFDFFLGLPEVDRRQVKTSAVRGCQLLEPLFEFSGACAGCGETPYVKLVSQLFGDRALIANATGCSSIYGGNLPTTPWAANAEGRGPAWSNSLFEDNAEFGLGFRLTLDQHRDTAQMLLRKLRDRIGTELADAILDAEQDDEAGIWEQRQRVELLREKLQLLQAQSTEAALLLGGLADALVKKSVWIIGGDGWAYDIGFGGLDHVLASGRNVNVLVLDTEVYSNTGGQMSKSTPRAAVAKFAAAGKQLPKKDLGLIAMTYGNVYVARVAMGANDAQTVRAFLEAEAYDGPSLIIAYSHCIAHGIDMRTAMSNQKLAVQCGHWPLFRFDPRRAPEGKNPLQLDSKPPSLPFGRYAEAEIRYKMLVKANPEEARRLQALAQEDVTARWRLYEQLVTVWAPRLEGPVAAVAGGPSPAVAPSPASAGPVARTPAPAGAAVQDGAAEVPPGAP
jgi:pyruvate-ferredoxin/flavodoxin oxidoreductase